MTARGLAIETRVAALEHVLAAGSGLLPGAAIERAEEIAARAARRLRHGTDHTVVALAGATGGGKSSLFNALVGEDLAPVGVRRPTTQHARAAIFGNEPPAGLLGWLGVRERHGVAPGTDLDGLVLVDLPDHDSVVREHRTEVDRLVALVDLMVWVLDPQKYADEALHSLYLRRLSRYGEVMLFALNQSDLVPAADRSRLLAHAESILRHGGLGSPTIIATSATTGEGVDELRSRLRERLTARDAALRRLDADLQTIAADLGPVPTAPATTDAGLVRDLAAGLTASAGGSAVGTAVDAGYRHDAARRTGWPFARWVLRLRRNPLRRLRPYATVGVGVQATTAVPVDPAGMRLAIKEYADARSGSVPPVWARRVREIGAAEAASIAPSLGSAVTAAARLAVAPAQWWRAVAGLQRVLAIAAVGGAVWLIGLALLDYLRVPTDELSPRLGGWPIPTLLLLGGMAAGMITGWAARAPAAVGGRRRARRAVRDIEHRVAEIATTRVVAPIEDELRRWADLSDALATVAGRR